MRAKICWAIHCILSHVKLEIRRSTPLWATLAAGTACALQVMHAQQLDAREERMQLWENNVSRREKMTCSSERMMGRGQQTR